LVRGRNERQLLMNEEERCGAGASEEGLHKTKGDVDKSSPDNSHLHVFVEYLSAKEEEG
jgi:hypothetical protein